MSSSTALLPKPNRKDDHPIFLRVCHSPWTRISQSLLVTARGFVAMYMSLVFAALIYYDIATAEHRWIIPFELPNIVYFLQMIYALVAFIWTYMHLHYPHQGISASPLGLGMRLRVFISPPRQNRSTKNREIFSLFYTVVVVFPHVVSLVYWLILVPHKQTIPVDTFGHDWFDTFCILNKYGFNAMIALLEILVLCSIKRQGPVWIHVLGLSVMCGVYVGWVYIGRLITGYFAYYFFDFEVHGWEYILVTIGSFLGLTNIFFAVNYGMIGLREMLTSESKDKSAGYTRLPQ